MATRRSRIREVRLRRGPRRLPSPSQGLGNRRASRSASSTSGELAAITSDVPDGPLEAGRDELMAHSQVLAETLDAARAVLPMRFGVVMPSDDSVREELLDAFRPDLEAQLDEMDGKIEMNVKGIYDEAAVLREVVAENREIARSAGGDRLGSTRRRLPRAHPPGRARGGGSSTRSARPMSTRVLDRLAPHAIAIEVNPPIHRAHGCERRVSARARRHRARSTTELERMAEENHPRIGFKLTGPLPPHSFVELALEAVMGLFKELALLPLAPVRGTVWVADQLAQEADRRLYDEDNIKRELLQLELDAEDGLVGARGARADGAGSLRPSCGGTGEGRRRRIAVSIRRPRIPEVTQSG